MAPPGGTAHCLGACQACPSGHRADVEPTEGDKSPLLVTSNQVNGSQEKHQSAPEFLNTATRSRKSEPGHWVGR